MLTIVNEKLHISTGVISEDRLLDVAITLKNTDEGYEVAGLDSAIRNAERHFIAQHLKNTLDRSQNWGLTRVVPEPIQHADLLIEITLVRSQGAEFIADVEARDASGRIWLKESYWQTATDRNFENLVQGERDVFQGFYNHIANSLNKVQSQMEDREISRIREISTLRFAAKISPEPFADYFTEDGQGIISLLRLPAHGTPEMERVLRVQKRDEMFGEIINGYYDDFYNKIWPSYESWRQEIMIERGAKYQVRRDGKKKALLGTVLLGAAAAVGASGAESSEALAAMMAGAGVIQVVSGISKLKQIKEHSAAIAELTESFATYSKPLVMEFEGKQYELQGTATEQFHKWQTLLQELYQQASSIDSVNEKQIP